MQENQGKIIIFPSHGPFCQQYHGPSAGPNRRHRASRSSHGMRLAKGGLRAESAKISLKRGGSPSTFAVAMSGRERRPAAKARAAANDRWEDHPLTKAARRAPKCASSGDDFNAALVLLGGINIQVTEPDVHGDCGTGLSAYAGCSTLEGPAPGTKDAWSPKGSCTRPQRQRAAVRGRGKRSRRRSSTRKSEELSDSSGATGLVTKTQAACGPA